MPATLARGLSVAAIACSLAVPCMANTVHLEFEGAIDINGFFPSDVGPPPDFIDNVVGMPVFGELSYNQMLLPDSNDGTAAIYTDPDGSLRLTFGEGGALGVFESDQPLRLSVANFPAGPSNPDMTFFRAEGNIGNPETDDFFLTFSALFRFGGLDGTGTGLPLPEGVDTSDLLDQDGNVGRGFITDEVGLTSYDITAVRTVPSPSALAAGGLLLLGFGLRRRRA